MNKKSGAMLVKKTWHRRHRSKDTTSISIPFDLPSEKLLKLKMLGRSVSHEGGIASVGEYDEQAKSYLIPIHVHGRNYTDGEEYVKKMSEIYGGSVYTDPHKYSIPSKAALSGTVLFTKDELRLKPRTQYTIAMRAYIVKTRPDPLAVNMAFRLEDDTLLPIRLPNPDQRSDVYGVFSSTKGGSIKQLEIYHESSLNRHLYPEYFGIFEGAYESHEECFEPYDGEIVNIALDEPLRGIGYCSDELDLISGTVKRRIAYIDDLSSLDFELDEDGITYLTLPMAAKLGAPALTFGPPLISEEELRSGSGTGVAISGDGARLLIRHTESCDPESALLYFSEHKASLAYVSDESREERVSTDIPYRDGYTAMEVLSPLKPRKFYAEYY